MIKKNIAIRLHVWTGDGSDPERIRTGSQIGEALVRCARLYHSGSFQKKSFQGFSMIHFFYLGLTYIYALLGRKSRCQHSTKVTVLFGGFHTSWV